MKPLPNYGTEGKIDSQYKLTTKFRNCYSDQMGVSSGRRRLALLSFSGISSSSFSLSWLLSSMMNSPRTRGLMLKARMWRSRQSPNMNLFVTSSRMSLIPSWNMKVILITGTFARSEISLCFPHIKYSNLTFIHLQSCACFNALSWQNISIWTIQEMQLHSALAG